MYKNIIGFMRREFFLILIFALSLFQLTILDYFKVFGAKPDFLLVATVMASLFFPFRWAIFFSLLCGILKDAFNVTPFGIYTLLFPLWSITIIKLSKEIALDNSHIYVALIAGIVIVDAVIIRFILLFFGSAVASLGIFLRLSLLESIYTALISPLLFKLTK